MQMKCFPDWRAFDLLNIFIEAFKYVRFIMPYITLNQFKLFFFNATSQIRNLCEQKPFYHWAPKAPKSFQIGKTVKELTLTNNILIGKQILIWEFQPFVLGPYYGNLFIFMVVH